MFSATTIGTRTSRDNVTLLQCCSNIKFTANRWSSAGFKSARMLRQVARYNIINLHIASVHKMTEHKCDEEHRQRGKQMMSVKTQGRKEGIEV